MRLSRIHLAVESFVFTLSLTLAAACAPQTEDELQPQESNLASGYGVNGSGGNAVFFVDNASWADLHYRVNGGQPLNVRMSVSNNHNEYVVGNLANLYAATLLFIAASLGLGLFVSTLAQTQFQAFQLAFITLLPSILLSGFMFPFEGMPVVAQWIAQVLPLTHFNVIIRGIMLRGADLPEVWPQLAKLAVFLTVMLSIAVTRFKKRLD